MTARELEELFAMVRDRIAHTMFLRQNKSKTSAEFISVFVSVVNRILHEDGIKLEILRTTWEQRGPAARSSSRSPHDDVAAACTPHAEPLTTVRQAVEFYLSSSA